MTQSSLQLFGVELKSYYNLVILNLCTGALAMAFVMVSLVMDFQTSGALPALSGIFTVRVAAGVASILISVFWITLSVKILNGIRGIWQEYKERTEPVPEKVLTGWIIGTVARYRKNRGTIQTMILVCTASGISLLVFGITSSLETVSVSPSAGMLTFSAWHVIPPALITLFIALVSLASSWYFAKFVEISDGRQLEIERGTEELERSLGVGKE
jgi:hypothetical protein